MGIKLQNLNGLWYLNYRGVFTDIHIYSLNRCGTVHTKSTPADQTIYLSFEYLKSRQNTQRKMRKLTGLDWICGLTVFSLKHIKAIVHLVG